MAGLADYTDENGDFDEAAYAQANPQEYARRSRAVVDQRIRDMCPKGLEHVADECVRQGLDLEDARARLKAALKKREEGITPDAVYRALTGRGLDPGDADPFTADEVERALKSVRAEAE